MPKYVENVVETIGAIFTIAISGIIFYVAIPERDEKGETHDK